MCCPRVSSMGECHVCECAFASASMMCFVFVSCCMVVLMLLSCCVSVSAFEVRGVNYMFAILSDFAVCILNVSISVAVCLLWCL